MSNPDISIVLTLHREGKYLPRTLMSLSEAAEFAKRAGLLLECIVVFDKSDASTRMAFACTPLDGMAVVKTIDAQNGCVSLSRNDGCAAAEGKYTFILDGDDLISYSIFPRLLQDAERFGPKTIVTPKFQFCFGRSFFTIEYFDSDEVNSEEMPFCNLFNARIFADSTLFRSLSYLPVAHSSGYAFEDWHFNCQAMALGYDFRTVTKTAWFYRQHLESRNHEAKSTTTQQTPPSELANPAIFLRRFPAPERRSTRPPAPRGGDVLSDPVYLDLLAHANNIEPALFVGNYHWRCVGHFNNITEGVMGQAYRYLSEIIGITRFDAVFLLPSNQFVDAPVLERMQNLATGQAGKNVAGWFNGEGAASDHVREKAPSIHVLDLEELIPNLAAVERDVLCLKLLQSSAADAPLHLVACDFAHRFFGRFRTILKARETTYHRPPYEVDTGGGEKLRASDVFQFISEFIDDLSCIAPLDNQSALSDQRRLQYGGSKYRDHPA
jgi:glycosyltransferase involved in cell wall biosynthesis